LLTIGFAGFRPPCGQRSVRTGVKTERPQRSEDGLRLDAGPARCMLSGGCRKISGGFCGCGAFSKPSWRTDPASHDSSPRLVFGALLDRAALVSDQPNLFPPALCIYKKQTLVATARANLGPTRDYQPTGAPKGPKRKSPEPNAGSELFRCPVGHVESAARHHRRRAGRTQQVRGRPRLRCVPPMGTAAVQTLPDKTWSSPPRCPVAKRTHEARVRPGPDSRRLGYERW